PGSDQPERQEYKFTSAVGRGLINLDILANNGNDASIIIENEDDSESISESESISASESLSESESLSASESQSESESISTSESLSESESLSASEYLSESESLSVSESLSESESLIDYLNGQISAYGEELGIPTPINTLLTHQIHQLEMKIM